MPGTAQYVVPGATQAGKVKDALDPAAEFVKSRYLGVLTRTALPAYQRE